MMEAGGAELNGHWGRTDAHGISSLYDSVHASVQHDRLPEALCARCSVPLVTLELSDMPTNTD